MHHLRIQQTEFYVSDYSGLKNDPFPLRKSHLMPAVIFDSYRFPTRRTVLEPEEGENEIWSHCVVVNDQSDLILRRNGRRHGDGW